MHVMTATENVCRYIVHNDHQFLTVMDLKCFSNHPLKHCSEGQFANIKEIVILLMLSCVLPSLCMPCLCLFVVVVFFLNQSHHGLKRWDYWDWIGNLPEMCNGNIKEPGLGWALQQASQCTDVHTAQGRGRLFIRIALVRGLLPTALHILARDPRLPEWYDPFCSIIGNEDLFGE
uniref:RUN domain-containing protein n=1 Tax=Eptatretus burgeri TaxID=7764 RepID=A0A8C4NB57_EPTBU